VQRLPGIGLSGGSVYGPILLASTLELGVPETTDDMIIDHADCLHEGVTNGWANEPEASSLQIRAHGLRLRRG
jgi:hypothetical protein